MKNNTSIFIITLVISIVIFILTFLMFYKILTALIPENLTISSMGVGGIFKANFFFSLLVGIAPILFYLTWRIVPIKSFFRRSTSVIIVILSIVLALVVRKEQLKSVNEQFANLKTESGEIILSKGIALDNLHFEYFLLSAILVSCLLCGFFLKEKSKTVSY